LKYLPFWNTIYFWDNHYNHNNNHNDYYNHDYLYHLYHLHLDYDDNLDQYRNEIISAIENWLKPNSINTLMDNFYIKFVAFVCLIGCSSLLHSKMPWKHITTTIEKFNNEEIRSYFIKDLEALYQKHKYGSEMFYLKLTDLIISYAKD